MKQLTLPNGKKLDVIPDMKIGIYRRTTKLDKLLGSEDEDAAETLLDLTAETLVLLFPNIVEDDIDDLTIPQALVLIREAIQLMHGGGEKEGDEKSPKAPRRKKT